MILMHFLVNWQRPHDSISDHLIGLRGVPTVEGEFIGMLDEYSAALNDTIYQLHGISSELCLKSRGEGDYPYRRYRADLDSFIRRIH